MVFSRHPLYVFQVTVLVFSILKKTPHSFSLLPGQLLSTVITFKGKKERKKIRMGNSLCLQNASEQLKGIWCNHHYYLCIQNKCRKLSNKVRSLDTLLLAVKDCAPENHEVEQEACLETQYKHQAQNPSQQGKHQG
jgi:hypothetical protein